MILQNKYEEFGGLVKTLQWLMAKLMMQSSFCWLSVKRTFLFTAIISKVFHFVCCFLSLSNFVKLLFIGVLAAHSDGLYVTQMCQETDG